ncbi:hypothetical protein GCM10010977_20970 [Citricoccus zhacaiensis]|uniref:D-alanyl-D-alanine carboxypeptidase-like core domain-containing protein n=1 Tax=Citricoccus zhacaiensis TaxID=489142 RepID=A0ABQ2M3G0_9MICC|nr:D-alanyl-D-alanine carboxypeptidase family protein [Citricoccus zhacaiensis]GGO46307.1 hypothetical protein GCM10010977_20970 [Citricoccus zhacaiensis]
MRSARPLVTAGVLALLLAGCSLPQDPVETPSDPPTPSSVEPQGPLPPVASLSISAGGTHSPSVAPAPQSELTVTASGPAASPSAPLADHDSPDSVHVLVNKLNPLDPADYAPQDLRGPDVPASKASMELRDEAAGAAEDLFAAASADEVDLTLVSAYRSYGYQQGTYGGWVERYGQAEADRISARPGFSEHQTGLAIDVGAADGACTLEQCFGDTPEGAWVAEHAAEHGWIIRYPDGAEDVTGYSPEPWHLRYVGTEAAAGVVRSGGVLETAWGFGPAPGY